MLFDTIISVSDSRTYTTTGHVTAGTTKHVPGLADLLGPLTAFMVMLALFIVMLIAFTIMAIEYHRAKSDLKMSSSSSTCHMISSPSA